MLAIGQELLIVGVVIVASAVGFAFATTLFIVQLRLARRRIRDLESWELRLVAPGVLRIPRTAQSTMDPTDIVAAQPETRRIPQDEDLATVPGWTAILVWDRDSSPQRPPEVVLVPNEVAGHSGGMFATEEAAESFRRNHLSRFEALHDRLDVLRTHCRAEIAGGGAEIARRLITLSAGDAVPG